MSEKYHQPREPERREPTLEGEDWYPSEEQLREFEEYLARERGDSIAVAMYGDELYTTIEKFARDPEHPTPEEINAVEDLNRENAPHVTTFEEYFGRPDPRKAEQDDQPAVDDGDDGPRRP